MGRIEMTNISASVGRGGVNRLSDVKTVQKLLNENIGLITPLRPLDEDGRIGPNTLSAIEEFQRRVVGMLKPDRRVDPNGRTWSALTKTSSGANPTPAVGSAKVTYSSSISASKKIVDPYTISVIELALKKVGMPQAVITSTIRTPDEQAHIMYRNAKKNLSGQFRLYGPTGDEVLKVYKANQKRPESEIIKRMKEKIESLLKTGRRTSNHVVTTTQYKALNIVDIGVNSTKSVCGTAFNLAKFTQAIKDLRTDGYIVRFIDETSKSNSCWHIEVKPNNKPLPAN
jgi:hypothetical protein